VSGVAAGAIGAFEQHDGHDEFVRTAVGFSDRCWIVL